MTATANLTRVVLNADDRDYPNLNPAAPRRAHLVTFRTLETEHVATYVVIGTVTQVKAWAGDHALPGGFCPDGLAYTILQNPWS